jgi:hypothetical protein
MKRKGLKDYKTGDTYILNPGQIPTVDELKHGQLAVDIAKQTMYASDQKRVVKIAREAGAPSLQEVTAIGNTTNRDINVLRNGHKTTLSNVGILLDNQDDLKDFSILDGVVSGGETVRQSFEDWLDLDPDSYLLGLFYVYDQVQWDDLYKEQYGDAIISDKSVVAVVGTEDAVEDIKVAAIGSVTHDLEREIETRIQGLYGSLNEVNDTVLAEIERSTSTDEALDERLNTIEAIADALDATYIAKANIPAGTTGVTANKRTVVQTVNLTDFTPTSAKLSVSSTDVTTSNSPVITDSVSIPASDGTNAGLMDAASYNQIVSNTADIAALKGANKRIPTLDALPADSTQQTLTALWNTVTGDKPLVDGDTLISFNDATLNYAWTYFATDLLWHFRGIDTVSVATNNSAGIVEGSTTPGMVYVEADGTMSLNGYDGLVDGISGLNTSLGQEVSDRTNAYNTLANNFVKNTRTVAGLALSQDLSVSSMKTALDIDDLDFVPNSLIDSKPYFTGLSAISASTNQCILKFSRVNSDNTASVVSIDLPVSSGSQAGVMTSYQYNVLSQAATMMTSLDNRLTVTTLVNVPTTNHIVEATISTNGQTLSFVNAANFPTGYDVVIFVKNNYGGTLTIYLPNSGNYQCMSPTTLEIPYGAYGEIHAVKAFGKVNIRAAAQSN